MMIIKYRMFKLFRVCGVTYIKATCGHLQSCNPAVIFITGF